MLEPLGHPKRVYVEEFEGSGLGSILEPFGLPNGVYVEGFGGSGLGSILGWFLGGGLGPL